MLDNKATVAISIDLELGWGLRDLPEERAATLGSDRSAETRYLARLLELCTDCSVPLTFATVGRLFDEGSRVTDRLDRQPDRALIDGHPQVSAATHYHAPAFLEMIRDHPVPHEIGTHTFSHVICDEASEASLHEEFRAVATLHEELGLDPPRSFVAPRNRLPPYDILEAHGIETVRVSRPEPSAETSGQLLNVLRSWAGSGDALTAPPTRQGGLTEVVSTPFPSLTALYLPAGGCPAPLPARSVPLRVRQHAHEWRLKRALDRAIETNGDLHLWSHLFNLANAAQWAPIEGFLRELAARRDRGEVSVHTMADYGRLPSVDSTFSFALKSSCSDSAEPGSVINNSTNSSRVRSREFMR